MVGNFWTRDHREPSKSCGLALVHDGIDVWASLLLVADPIFKWASIETSILTHALCSTFLKINSVLWLASRATFHWISVLFFLFIEHMSKNQGYLSSSLWFIPSSSICMTQKKKLPKFLNPLSYNVGHGHGLTLEIGYNM